MRLILVVFFLFQFAFINAQSNYGHSPSWKLMLAEAKSHNKKVLLYFGAEWCAPCKQIEKNVFSDSGSNAAIKRKFNVYKIDFDHSEAYPFLAKYRVTTVPLVVILNSGGYQILRVETPPVKSNEFLELFLNVPDTSVFKGISNKLYLNYPSFYTRYFKNRGKLPIDSIEVVKYLLQQKNLTTEVNWNVFSVLNPSDSLYYRFAKDNHIFFELYGMEAKFKLVEMYKRISDRYIATKDSASFSVVTSYLTDDEQSRILHLLRFLGRTGMDPQKMEQNIIDFVSRFGNRSNYTISEYALYTKPTYNTLIFIRDFLSTYIQKRGNSSSYFRLAKCLFYLGEFEKADFFFEKCLEHTPTEDDKAHIIETIEKFKAENL